MGSLIFRHSFLVDGEDAALVSCHDREGDASLSKEEPAMHGEGCASVMGKSLHISVEGPCLHIVVRRTDGQDDEHLFAFDDRQVSTCDLRRLLPHFQSLTWRRGGLSAESREILATDGDYTVSLLYGTEDAGEEERMIAEFNEFLCEYLAQ